MILINAWSSILYIRVTISIIYLAGLIIVEILLFALARYITSTRLPPSIVSATLTDLGEVIFISFLGGKRSQVCRLLGIQAFVLVVTL